MIRLDTPAPSAATTYPCVEYGEVTVPVSEVIDRGELDVFPEVRSKGYFDIDFRQGRLVLTAKNYVGLIPLNDRVSIHVAPRAPIHNILYIAQRAHKAVSYVARFTRRYGLTRLASGPPEDIFAEPLLRCLLDVERNGLMRRYVTRVTEGFRGRILITPTLTKRLSNRLGAGQVRETTEFSVDIPENRVVKDVIRHIYRYFSNIGRKDAQILARQAASLIVLFDTVPDPRQGSVELFKTLPEMIRRLPGNHAAYEHILWLCYLISSKQGVSLETFGPARIETMLINLADVFEGYVRALVGENLHRFLPGAQWYDGNLRHVPLFRQGEDTKVKPDVYVTINGKAVLIIDAKYKPQIKSADRYEILAFCEALQARCAVFVSPAETGGPPTTFLGRTPGNVELHEIRLDLGSSQMGVEEDLFVSRLRTVMDEHLKSARSGVLQATQ